MCPLHCGVPTATRRRRALLALSLILGPLSGLLASPLAAQADLLSTQTLGESFGAVRERHLVDRLVPAPNAPIDDWVVTLLLGPDAAVPFDFQSPTPVAAIRVVGVDDSFEVALSTTGRDDWRTVALRESHRDGRLIVFESGPIEGSFRALRVGVASGHQRGAVAEILAASEYPATWPELEPRLPPTFDAAVAHLLRVETRISRGLAAVGLLAALLLWRALGASAGAKRRICFAVVLLSIVGWTRFGTFHGGGRVLHAWDLTHYALGSAYFDELGYTELYRCLASWERSRGRGALVDRTRVRDLDDNQVYPGSWTRTPEGRCRAEFTPERWRDFGGDADALRGLFVFRRIHDTLRDHGYNATPLQTVLLRALRGGLPLRPHVLTALASVDALALGGVVALIWWGFGPLAGAAGALVLGFGDPWAYTWTGGSFGRSLWLLVLVAGLVLVAKRRWGPGSFLVTTAGLLRLFPLALLAGPALWVLRSRRRPRDRPAAVALFCGSILAIVLGTTLSLLALGPEAHADFVENSRLHAQVPSVNFMGMATLARAGEEPRAEADDSGTVEASLRAVLWAATLLAAGLWLVRVARSAGVEPWQALVLSSPIVFATVPLSSYDYAWLVLLVPLAVRSRPTLATLLAFVVASNLIGELLPEGRGTYVAFSLGVLFVLGVFCTESFRRPTGTDPRELRLESEEPSPTGSA